jgi:hypothetical protein
MHVRCPHCQNPIEIAVLPSGGEISCPTIRGDPERIMLWTQVITGFELDELTAVRVLDAATLAAAPPAPARTRRPAGKRLACPIFCSFGG